MNEKKIFVIILAFVTIVMGFFVANDIAKKHGVDIKNSWNWNNDWDKIEDQNILPPDNPKPNPPIQKENLVAKSYEEAISMGKQSGKNIFIFFGADWCDYCNSMKSNVLSNANVKSSMSKYVFLEVNVDADKKLSKKYDVKGLPTYVVITVDEAVVKKGSGYKGEESFISWLR